MSKPATRDFHSYDDDQIHRFVAEGKLTPEMARKLLINYDEGQVIMIAFGEDGHVYADITTEHYAAKKYGRDKIFGPEVKGTKR